MLLDTTKPPQSLSSTIGIVTTVWSYYDFLTGWCESIQALNRQPDKIVIAAHDANKVRGIVAPLLSNATVVQVDEDFSWGYYLNRAVEACETDWIAWIGVDDRYRPCALDGIDCATVDIVGFGMKYEKDGRQWHYGGRIQDWPHYNPLPPGSPFRRHLWEKLPFQSQLFWPDLAFWASADFLGANAIGTGRIDFDYAYHSSQVDTTPDVNKKHLADICNWISTLHNHSL
jgi:hypothetical protein